MAKDQRIALAGFGNVGRAIAQLIADGHPAAENVSIAAVTSRRLGTVISDGELDPTALLTAADTGSFDTINGFRGHLSVSQMIDQADADTLVELTLTDLATGEPAATYVREALSMGWNVSTTNKGPIALHLDELLHIAEETHAVLAFEGTVMSGTPTLLIAAESIRGAGCVGATGILNGTTNYIITRMEEGSTYSDALREAQSLGYAEADPSGDVDGHDVAGKLAILAKVLTGVDLDPLTIPRVSLSTLTSEFVSEALESGEHWKYMATLTLDDGEWSASVEPRRIGFSHPLATVRGATNAIAFDTELLGTVSLVGPGAGRTETAYSIFTDLALIARRRFA